jgi:hypothetical protein
MREVPIRQRFWRHEEGSVVHRSREISAFEFCGVGMIGSPLASSAHKALDVAMIHGCSSPPDLHNCVPAGHCVSRARLRYLRESEWIVVTDGSVPVGLAAYKRADGEIRVVTNSY